MGAYPRRVMGKIFLVLISLLWLRYWYVLYFYCVSVVSTSILSLQLQGASTLLLDLWTPLKDFRSADPFLSPLNFWLRP